MNFLAINLKINSPYLRFEKIQINSLCNIVSIKLSNIFFRKRNYSLVRAEKYRTSIGESYNLWQNKNITSFFIN